MKARSGPPVNGGRSVGAGEELDRRLDELRDEGAGVVGTGGDDDLARFDPVDGDGDETGAERETPVTRGDDGDGGAVGDGFELVVVGVGKGGAERGREPSGRGSRRQKALQSGLMPVQPTRGSAAMSAAVTDSLPARRWDADTSRTRGSV